MIIAQLVYDTWFRNECTVHNLMTRCHQFLTVTSLANTVAYYNALANPNCNVETITRPDDVVQIEELSLNTTSSALSMIISRVIVAGEPLTDPASSDQSNEP